MLIIDSDGGLYKDQAEALKTFVEANTKIPTGSAYDFMAPFAMMTYGKVAEEQGIWSAGAALKIFGGTAAGAIPIEQNKEGKLIINTRIAKTMGVEIPFDLLRSADQVIE